MMRAPGVSGGIQTLNFGITGLVFYHCANRVLWYKIAAIKSLIALALTAENGLEPSDLKNQFFVERSF